MSTTKSTKNAKVNAPADATGSASAAPTAQDTTALSTGNVSLPETATIKIGDDDVTLGNKFLSLVGQPLTADYAKIIFSHVVGQFRNNQNANAIARNKRIEAGKATEEDKAFIANPVEALLKIWETYMPNVGEQRMGSLEKLRREAARLAYVQLVLDHNSAIEQGLPPVIKNKTTKVAPLTRPVKTKNVSDAQHEENLRNYEATMATIIDRMLSTPSMAGRVQVEQDKLEAQRATKKGEAETVATVTADSLELA